MISLQIPMPGEEGGIGPAGPAVPPSVDYAVKTYMPFLAATVIAPLIGLLYVWIRSTHQARRGSIVTRPDHTGYSVYLIAGLFPLMGGAPVLYKLVLDYVYGRLATWRYITYPYHLDIYLSIARFLSHFYLLAGVAIGLSTLLIIFHKTYENWYMDLAIYLGNIAWFLYLTPRPLQEFKYTMYYVEHYHPPPGTQPYDLIEPLFHQRLYLGIAIGLTLTAVTYLYSRRRKTIH